MRLRHLLLVLPLLTLMGCPPGPNPEPDPTPNPPINTDNYVATTNEVVSFTPLSAICAGNANANHSYNIKEKGICWSTNDNPSIENNYVTAKYNGAGDFTCAILGLDENTTYFFRAYLKTKEDSYFYGEVKHFTTKSLPEGVIRGVFSISDTEQVMFSKGNLQYQASTDTWRFAENQYDYVGNDIYGNVMENGVKCDNSLISPDYDGWIDLFGWGTSGWDNGNVFYHPYDYYTDSIDGNHGFGYGPTNGFSYLFNLTGDYAGADWGIHNPINNGGDKAGQWRTLTPEEWNYIMGSLTNGRPNASEKKFSATVNGVPGAIILPDYWVCPENITYSSTSSHYQDNDFTIAQWQKMEEAGAVFLPSSGYRNAKHTTLGPGSMINGYYWLAHYDTNEKCARFFNVFETGATLSLNNHGYFRYNGYSVRLVKTN